MFAFVNYAGGCMEFRLTQREDGMVTVRHWVLEPNPTEVPEMVPDKSRKTEVFPDIFQAMDYIANEIQP